jgi:cytochrome c1
MTLHRKFLALLVAGAFAAGGAGIAAAAESVAPPKENWTFAGPFGTFDRAQLQRGFKVYREVCQNCHGLSLISFRNLAEPGGPEYTPAQAAAIAAEYKVKDGPNDQGEMFERPGRPADRFPAPFPNDQAARAANGGASPPDLSVIAKARTYERGFPWFLLDIFPFPYQENGVDYILALLKGYEQKPANVSIPEGSHYNKYFPGNAIGMPPPLSDGQVTYDDGAPATIDQYARDITAFLMWTAEPHLEARKRVGLQVIIFLLGFAVLLYFTKKRIWKQVELHPEELRPREAGPGEYRRH